MAELMKDAELEEVVGGSGMETMGLMARLQSEGIATFSTPLVAGNEAAAAKELQTFLENVEDNSRSPGFRPFAGCRIYSDDESNLYSGFLLKGNDQHIGAEDVIKILKNIK